MSKLVFDAIAGMVFYKYLAALLVVVLLVELYNLGLVGRRLAKPGIARNVRSDLIRTHEWWAQMALWTALLAVATIEFLVRFASAPHSVNLWLYWPNIICGVTALLLFIAIRWLNGDKFPRLHWKLVYGTGVLFSVALVTGLPLLYELPLL